MTRAVIVPLRYHSLGWTDDFEST